MDIRKSAASLAILAQVLAFTAPAAVAQDSGTAPASSEQALVAHRAIQGIQERLAEADATISALEQSAAQLQGEARAKANAALQTLRAKRDAYRAQAKTAVANITSWTKTQAADAEKELDDDWASYQLARDEYLDSVKADLATRQAALNAELDASRQSWRASIEDLRVRAQTLSAEQRAAIDARITALKADADSAKTRIGRLREASGEAWKTAQKSLSDAKTLFDDSYASIRKTIEDAVK
jgi:hypothetical protein